MNTDLTIIKGDTSPFTVNVLVNDVALNITGYTFFFTAKKKIGDTDANAVIAKTITDLADPTHGIMTILLTSDDTDITSGTYLYDIQMVSPSTGTSGTSGTSAVTGTVTTLFYGTLTVLPEVTQRVR